jgi:hypothetical protein
VRVLATSSNEIMNALAPARRNGSSLATTASRSAGHEKQRSRLGGASGAAAVGISGSAGERLGIQSIPCARAKEISRSNAACSSAG